MSRLPRGLQMYNIIVVDTKAFNVEYFTITFSPTPPLLTNGGRSHYVNLLLFLVFDVVTVP